MEPQWEKWWGTEKRNMIRYVVVGTGEVAQSQKNTNGMYSPY